MALNDCIRAIFVKSAPKSEAIKAMSVAPPGALANMADFLSNQ